MIQGIPTIERVTERGIVGNVLPYGQQHIMLFLRTTPFIEIWEWDDEQGFGRMLPNPGALQGNQWTTSGGYGVDPRLLVYPCSTGGTNNCMARFTGMSGVEAAVRQSPIAPTIVTIRLQPSSYTDHVYVLNSTTAPYCERFRCPGGVWDGTRETMFADMGIILKVKPIFGGTKLAVMTTVLGTSRIYSLDPTTGEPTTYRQLSDQVNSSCYRVFDAGSVFGNRGSNGSCFELWRHDGGDNFTKYANTVYPNSPGAGEAGAISSDHTFVVASYNSATLGYVRGWPLSLSSGWGTMWSPLMGVSGFPLSLTLGMTNRTMLVCTEVSPYYELYRISPSGFGEKLTMANMPTRPSYMTMLINRNRSALQC